MCVGGNSNSHFFVVQWVDDEEDIIIGEGETTNVLHYNDSAQHELTFDQMLDNKYSHLQIK